MQAENTWTTEKWIKIYKVFKLKDLTSYDSSIGYTDIQECDSFNILFYLSKNGSFQIKQPKLELGNIPSSWSSSPYDIDFSDVSGTNLGIVDGLLIKVGPDDSTAGESIKKLKFGSGLTVGQTYTFSFSDYYWEGDTSILYCDGGSTSVTISTTSKKITFKATKGDFSLWTNANVIVLKQAKLEKGSIATPFIMQEDYILSLLDGLENTSQENSTNIGILTANGNTILTTVGGLTTTLNDLSKKAVTIDQVKAAIQLENSTFTTQIDDYGTYIKQIRGYIQLDDSDATNPFLKLGSQTGTSHIFAKLEKDKLGFYQGSNTEPVAYISGNFLEINSARFKKSFYIDTLKVAITDSGVGFTWG